MIFIFQPIPSCEMTKDRFWGAKFKSGRIFWITFPLGAYTGRRRGGEKGIFIFQLISSFEISRGRFFGVLNSNLVEIFGSPPPLMVYPGERLTNSLFKCHPKRQYLPFQETTIKVAGKIFLGSVQSINLPSFLIKNSLLTVRQSLILH